MALLTDRHLKPPPGLIFPGEVPSPASDLWRGLSLAMPFWDHGSGGIADVSRNNLHATFGSHLTPDAWIATPYGAGLSFDGYEYDVATVSDPPTDLLDGTDKLSIEALFRIDSVGTLRTIVSKYRLTTGMRSWELDVETSGKLRFQISDDGSSYEIQYTATWTASANTWYHLVLTFDAGTWVPYLDGVAQSVDAAFTDTSIYGGTCDLLLGCRYGSGGTPLQQWLGDIAGLRIWRGRVLTAAEAAFLARDPWAMYRQDWPWGDGAVLHSGATPAGEWVKFGEVDEGVESVVIAGLENGVEYDVMVKTVDDSGNISSGCTPVSETPTAAAPIQPDIIRSPLTTPTQLPPWSRAYR